EDGIRDFHVTGVQTCALPISAAMSAVVGPPSRSRAAMAPPTRVLAIPGRPRSLPSSRLVVAVVRESRSAIERLPGLYKAASPLRSEERRVGKAGRAGVWTDDG